MPSRSAASPRTAVHMRPGRAAAESRGSPVRRAATAPTGRGFIGDYFGLAISGGNIYTLGVSTHYPSATVTADDGGPVYYQNQVLGISPKLCREVRGVPLPRSRDDLPDHDPDQDERGEDTGTEGDEHRAGTAATPSRSRRREVQLTRPRRAPAPPPLSLRPCRRVIDWVARSSDGVMPLLSRRELKSDTRPDACEGEHDCERVLTVGLAVVGDP